MSRPSGSFSPPAGFRDSPAPPLPAGEVIASTYAIREEIARTETGTVFEARDMLLDRLVAFKIAWRDAGTPSLLPEARRCAAVRDPCAVQVHGMGTHNGCEYVVGERVLGHLLHDELARPLAPEVYLRSLRALYAAVARAHDAGIAVGDVSGSTVLMCPDSRVVLGRLSLSQVPAFGPQGQVLAPEVVRGEVDAGDPTAAEAIDLYGLGCVAIELASGSPPFSDDTPQRELRGHANEPPPRISDLRADLPGELSDLVDWLLAKRPAARPRSVADVLAQLDAIVERVAPALHSLRVLIVDDDTARARWLWSLARRAHSSTIVETASEGTDAAHKLNRDQPDLIFIDAALRGVMNALELCMYARGLDGSHGKLCLIGSVSDKDRALLAAADVELVADDAALPGTILDRVRTAVAGGVRPPRSRSLVSG
ncbi:MAG: protein kinase domain-containing protein [Acidobacteriota bacterium]